jgi:AmmeMemoRadiSam system protein A
MSDDNKHLKGEILLSIARAAISQALGLPFAEISEQADWLQEKAACFVTLSQNGQLRGCIGTLEAQRSLLEDVKANAVAAALKDTRFPPLSSEELNETDIEVSLLSPMQALSFDNEEEALAQLRPGIDGVVSAITGYKNVHGASKTKSRIESRLLGRGCQTLSLHGN